MNRLNYGILFFLIIILMQCNQVSTNEETKIVKFEPSKKKLKSTADSLYKASNYVLAIKYLDSIIYLDSTNGENYFMRAYCYDQVSKHTELQQSIRDYNMAIQLGYNKAKLYYNLGLCYVGVKDSIALKYFKKSLDIDPNYYQSSIQIDGAEKRLQWEKTHQYRQK